MWVCMYVCTRVNAKKEEKIKKKARAYNLGLNQQSKNQQSNVHIFFEQRSAKKRQLLKKCFFRDAVLSTFDLFGFGFVHRTVILGHKLGFCLYSGCNHYVVA